jgi:hypothetical protein
VRDARAWCPARPTGWRRHPASGSSRTRKSANPTNSSVANTA